MEIATSHFQFFACLGKLFEARFLRPLWQRYPLRDSDIWEAVALFLEGYASERQGAKPDYRHAAVDIAKELAQARQSLDGNTAQLVWKLFCHRLGEENLNHANNPLCPLGTSYERKTGAAVTNSKSIIEFLHEMSQTIHDPNIVVLAKTGLTLDRTKVVYEAIQEINGIGTKIASLFLRDVAVFYNIYPNNDRHLLQPVDVWVNRAFKQLASSDRLKTQDTESVQGWIVESALKAGVRAEAVNEGIWYFSSQVANSDYRMSKALSDFKYARALLEQHMEAVSQELSVWEKLVKGQESR